MFIKAIGFGSKVRLNLSLEGIFCLSGLDYETN